MTTTGTATIIRGDARSLPLADASVDLIVTSPPYWGLRAYEDNGEVYNGQIGNEPTPAEWLANLIDCTREWVRILKPTGSIFVNLSDAYANTATPERTGSSDGATSRATRPGRRSSTGAGVRPKSLYGLPWRYALACIDELELILRRDQIWHKTTALPESVTDRAATRHEYLFHLVTQERYFAAIDEIRQPYAAKTYTVNTTPRRSDNGSSGDRRNKWHTDNGVTRPAMLNPLGAIPGSVWDIPAEPLRIPDHVVHARCCGGVKVENCADGVDHFAAWPTELVRRVILGWTPSGICVGCGTGRTPVVDRGPARGDFVNGDRGIRSGRSANSAERNRIYRERVAAGIGPRLTGYACACPDTNAPTRPAVVVDPFGGTGTTALVAKALGRHGITIDRSADYCRLATWRTTDPAQLAKAMRVPKPPTQSNGQGELDLFAQEAS